MFLSHKSLTYTQKTSSHMRGSPCVPLQASLKRIMVRYICGDKISLAMSDDQASRSTNNLLDVHYRDIAVEENSMVGSQYVL